MEATTATSPAPGPPPTKYGTSSPIDNSSPPAENSPKTTPSSKQKQQRRRINLNLMSTSPSSTSVQTPNTGVETNNTGVRLYQVGMDMKQSQQNKLQNMFDEEQRQRELKTSPKTVQLAYLHWVRKMTKLFEEAKDYDRVTGTISLESCLKCFQLCGLLARSRHSKTPSAFTSESVLNTTADVTSSLQDSALDTPASPPSQNLSSLNQTPSSITSPQKLKQQRQVEVMSLLLRQAGDGINSIYLDRVLRLIGIAVGRIELVGEEFDRKLVNWLKERISTPAAKPSKPSPEKVPTKTITVREFLSHLDQDMQHSQEIYENLKREREAELAKEFTFRPKISPSKSTKNKPATTASIYSRLYDEASTREKVATEMRLKASKEKLDRMAKECTFSPTITQLPKVDDDDIPELEMHAIQNHFLRLELARIKKDDEQKRFEALGQVSPIKVNNTTREAIPSRLYPKKTNLMNPSSSPDLFVDVILPSERQVRIHVSHLDNITQLSDEFARKFQLDILERNAVEEAIRQALFLNLENENNSSGEDGSSSNQLERYWDNFTRQWYLFDPVTGETKWAST